VHERRLPHAWRRVAEQAERRGHGLAYAPIADGPRWLVRRSGVAFNSFERIVMSLARFPHFQLRLGAHAQRLTWDAVHGRVDGVEYADHVTGAAHHVAAAAVVLAAGPLASPKLLLQSASCAFPEGLGNSQGVLGRFLHEHAKDWCVLRLDKALPRLDQPLHFTRAPYSQSAPLQAALLTIGPLSKWDRVLSLAQVTTASFGLVAFACMLPEECNYLRLHPERRDRFGLPVLDLHIRFGRDVAPAIAEAHSRLRTSLEQAGIRATIDCPQERLTPGAAAHYGGGARMHASPQYGVLNGWNRLHDANNVSVVDASSFTTGVEKNPTLTVMALAARAADRLAYDLRHDAAG
jgi:choline dehydrogenase-like flavoprotein